MPRPPPAGVAGALYPLRRWGSLDVPCCLALPCNTQVRELSNHAAEIWAMRQLGNEIYARPSCGYGGNSSSCSGAAWLQEQLGTSYQPAWFDQLAAPNGADAAIEQAGTAGC